MTSNNLYIMPNAIDIFNLMLSDVPNNLNLYIHFMKLTEKSERVEAHVYLAEEMMNEDDMIFITNKRLRELYEAKVTRMTDLEIQSKNLEVDDESYDTMCEKISWGLKYIFVKDIVTDIVRSKANRVMKMLNDCESLQIIECHNCFILSKI